jgi:putative ABC transport system permease protein
VNTNSESWSFGNIRRDLRYGLRQLRRSPGFGFLVTLTLALGIGANTAIFSIVEGVLLRPLPYQHPERLVVIWQTDALHHDSGAFFNTYREFDAWQQHSRSFEKLAALTWATGPRTMLWQGKPLDTLALPASVDFFSMLGQSARFGRTFTRTDLQNSCTLVLAYHFWQQKLGAPSDIVGHSLTLGKSSCEVVGVMPKGFSFYPIATDAWSLITPAGEFAQKPWQSMTGAFGLLKPGVTRAAAESELTAIQAQVLPEAPADLKMMRSLTPDVLNLQSNFTWLAGRNLRKGLWLLLGASGVILLLASVNVGSLVLGRAMARSREMAIRAAVGATRRRLVGQALTESLLLGFLGAVAGLAVAAVLVQWFRAANPIELPPGAVITVDWSALLFTALSAGLSSITFALFPAWRGSRTDVNAVLKSASLGLSHGVAAQRAAQSMVVVQVGLSMTLVVGAGLLAESLWKLAATNLGYRTDHIFTARINLPDDRYADAGARSRLGAMLETDLAALPSVGSVGIGSDFVPRGFNQISIAGKSGAERPSSEVATQDVSPGTFRTLDIPLVKGRTFDDRDRRDTQPVVIINEALAREFFPGVDPLGQAVKLSSANDPSLPWLTIIGVVANVKTTTVFQEMGYIEPPAVYRPLSQSDPRSIMQMVAAGGNPSALVNEIQQRISAIDPNLVIVDIDGMRVSRRVELSQPRFRSVLFSGFAGLALLLALVGLYALLAQTVARRSRDIGIRMALGATRDRILRSVLGQACALTVTGIAIGASVSIAEIRLIRGMLFGVTLQGVGELALAALAMLIVTIVAAGFPAYRAASIDPMRELRSQ